MCVSQMEKLNGTFFDLLVLNTIIIICTIVYKSSIDAVIRCQNKSGDLPSLCNLGR